MQIKYNIWNLFIDTITKTLYVSWTKFCKVTGIKKYLCSVILSSYIGLVWTCRNEYLSFSVMKLKLITRIKYNIKTILLCPDIKSEIRNMLKELDTNC